MVTINRKIKEKLKRKAFEPSARSFTENKSCTETIIMNDNSLHESIEMI